MRDVHKGLWIKEEYKCIQFARNWIVNATIYHSIDMNCGTFVAVYPDHTPPWWIGLSALTAETQVNITREGGLFYWTSEQLWLSLALGLRPCALYQIIAVWIWSITVLGLTQQLYRRYWLVTRKKCHQSMICLFMNSFICIRQHKQIHNGTGTGLLPSNAYTFLASYFVKYAFICTFPFIVHPVKSESVESGFGGDVGFRWVDSLIVSTLLQWRLAVITSY